jgi:3alpha(or 20beta)-hydroxysteroid dehydrogenase
MSGRIEGKVALVTGAARGMGAAISRRFAAEGAKVVLGDVRADDVRATAGAIDDDFPGAAIAVELDVTSEASWNAAVAATIDAFGELHVLVNNAGVTGNAHGSLIDDYPVDDWQFVLGVNLTGPFLGMRAVVPHIRAAIERKRAAGDATATGSIVNISSAQGIRPSHGNAAYASSKWGLRGLTKVVALDAAPLVRVNSVHPGPVETPMIAGTLADNNQILQYLQSEMPLARIGQPDDVANLVLFLASDESGFSTGAEFLVEGGRLAGPPRPA